ncbi:MAG: hypothetical protein H0V89_03395 [Deltaproteobacteria bacterium]|nr:hypothetical protein [Deltaproteobacteria bacterium]
MPVGMGRTVGIAAFASGLAWISGCDDVREFIAGEPDLTAANGTLAAGDLPGAAASWETLSVDHPDSVDVAVGRSYTQLLAGDTAGADATLAAIEPTAGEKTGEIKLRRALVALRAGKQLDAVKKFGAESGLPEGKLLAAEVHLVDLESDEGAALFRELSAAGGSVGETAATYLRMLESDNQHLAGLAEATALWALGEREQAVKSAEELVKALPSDQEGKPEILMVWASRAATSGKPAIANSLLDDLDSPPEGQAWRVEATRAIAAVAGGELDVARSKFEALRAGGAPPAGVDDALATACMVAADADAARQLVQGVESAAAARCLAKAGDAGAAGQAPAGPLKTFLENP